MSDDFEALKKEALAWIVRLTSGEATTDDRDALMRWRARSLDNEHAFREATRLWKDLGPALAPYTEMPHSVLSRRSFLVGGATAVASMAGLTFGLSQLGVLPTIEAMLSDYATAVGEQKTIQLPDGSMATLDGGTTLTVEFSDATRKVGLATGAAVFNIVEQRRPFIVMAKAGKSTAQRASVSVKHGVEDVSVDCLEGEIDVECLGTAALRAKEGITYSATGLGEKIDTDTEDAAAWRNGLLIFRDRPLADVISDVNRHRRGKVVIARSSLRSRRVSGVFHLDRPEEILAHLESTLHVRPINLVGGVVVLQ